MSSNHHSPDGSTDDATADYYPCARCGHPHETRGAALRCCSGAFDDTDPDAEGAESLAPTCPDEHGAPLRTDGGKRRVAHELERLRRSQERREEHAERQAEALERLADQLEVQNAVLFETLRQQERLNEIAMERPPDETRTPESTATAVQDGILHLAERIDIEDARRWADD